MKSNTLAIRVGLGYLLLVAVLGVAVLATLVQVRSLQDSVERLYAQRIPTSEAGMAMKGGIYRSAAALRGWLITRDETLLTALRQAWSDEIEPSLLILENQSANWSDTENKSRFQQLKPRIEQLHDLQLRAQEFSSADADAAVKWLHDRVIPQANEIELILTQMVDDQKRLTHREVDDISREVTFLTNLEWLLLLAGVVVGSILSVLIARSISRPVAHAVTVAEKIGQGDLDTAVNVGGVRELETLGAALTTMRDSLKAKTRENEQFNWHSMGQNQLYEAMRGEMKVEQLANRIVTFLAAYTGANVGSLYLVNEDSNGLSLAGGYAFGGERAIHHFHMGEGLLGQAAVEKKPLALQDISDGHIRVSSSLVDGPPRHIYVSPFVFEDAVLGVVELGKFEPFSELERDFIDASMEAIGIGLNSARARSRIQQLLEETQQQSEELQQQQEELEQTNEELGGQAQHLLEQQEELQAANEELEEQAQLIAEKNDGLEAAKESIEFKARQLEISSKYKSEFLANMSHELRTPLNSLLILANDLANNGRGNLDDEQVESAQVISKSGRDLLRLINDILDLSKVEAGKLDINVAPISLSELADDIRRNFRRQAGNKRLKFDVTVDPALPATLQNDRQRLDQILANLISNALKFTEEGGVDVAFSPGPDNSVAIAVRDTGIGIPRDKQAAVFEAFVQAEGGTSRKYGGTGLGLSISRELAKLLNGRIDVDSELGQGSTFTLVIPLAIESRQASSAAPPSRPAVHKVVVTGSDSPFVDFSTIPDQRNEVKEGDRVILIVEDDESFARVLAEQAKRKGFKHINAATGEDALRLASRYLPHAMILDIELPGMDGNEVLRELKSDPELRHIPVHIMSARERSLDSIRYGALDYLTKPIAREQLEDAFVRMEGFISRKMKNLLIVEDNDAMRKAIATLVGNGDVQCFEASTGREALQFCRDNAVDCMVLDVGLPDMSGFEVIKALEQQDKENVPPIIIYTGRELTKEENSELQQHAESIIVKGVKSEERLLDETALFLHRTIKNLPPSKKNIIAKLYDKEALLQGKKILLVDDDMRNVFALSKVLRDQGVDVIKAENGFVALARLAEHPDMDLVLMDIMMPEMDGYECMQKIRQRREVQNIPIVALTAKAMKDDRQKCIDAGANDYISKPVDVERLISLLRIWIKR